MSKMKYPAYQLAIRIGKTITKDIALIIQYIGNPNRLWMRILGYCTLIYPGVTPEHRLASAGF